jgi:hypothetical protein
VKICSATVSTASATAGDSGVPVFESSAFDEVSDEMLREPAQAARQLDGFGGAERMGRRGRETKRKQGSLQIKTVDPARFGDRRHRIDDNDIGDTSEPPWSAL